MCSLWKKSYLSQQTKRLSLLQGIQLPLVDVTGDALDDTHFSGEMLQDVPDYSSTL